MAAIIFDFDGTIADSFDFVTGFLAAEAGLPPLDDQQKLELRGLSMAAIGRHFGLSWWRLLWLLSKGRRQMGRVIKRQRPFDGLPEVIRKLSAEGHELFIVSSNSVRNVHAFLHHHDLHSYFLEVYGGISLFGKAPALRRLLREQGLPAADAVYVGDEIRDVQAAKSVGVPAVAVTWGFARTADLADLRPLALAGNPQELLEILASL